MAGPDPPGIPSIPLIALECAAPRPLVALATDRAASVPVAANTKSTFQANSLMRPNGHT